MSLSYSQWAEKFSYDFGVETPHLELYKPYPHKHDEIDTETNVDVTNATDIDFDNAVQAAQETEVNLELGHFASAAIGDSMNTAPQQQLAVGNFDGKVETGEVAVEADTAIDAGHDWFGWGRGRDIDTETNVDVANVTDIDFDNDVTAIQSTLINVELGDGAYAAIGDSLNAAPSQNIAVGNFGGDVDTGDVYVEANDFVG